MPPPTSSSRSYLPGLTGLRGVGAVWVMMFHAQYGVDLPVLENGFLGVDLFFILSGFVLSHAHRDLRMDWPGYLHFLRDRVARIFPLHWVGLGFVGLVLLTYSPVYRSMGSRFQLADLPANMLLVQNWGFTQTATWNVPAWSLSTEWLVSLAFPVFLLGARRVQRPSMGVLGCAVCLGLFELFLLVTGNPNPGVQARAGIVRTALEFATGCLLYRVFLADIRVTLPFRVAALVLLLVGLSAPDRTMLAVVAFPIVILLSTEAGPVRSLLASGPVAFLGKISFSVYLLHWILLQASDRIEMALGVHGLWSVAWFGGYFAVVIALSTLTYHAVENPARIWIRKLRLPLGVRSRRLLQLDR